MGAAGAGGGGGAPRVLPAPSGSACGAPDALTPVIGPDSAAILVDVAKKATITRQESYLRVQMHVDPAQLDALLRASSASMPLGEAYKTLRLYQLLVPGL